MSSPAQYSQGHSITAQCNPVQPNAAQTAHYSQLQSKTAQAVQWV